jgi:hypothetical protein
MKALPASIFLKPVETLGGLYKCVKFAFNELSVKISLAINCNLIFLLCMTMFLECLKVSSSILFPCGKTRQIASFSFPKDSSHRRRG